MPCRPQAHEPASDPTGPLADRLPTPGYVAGETRAKPFVPLDDLLARHVFVLFLKPRTLLLFVFVTGHFELLDRLIRLSQQAGEPANGVQTASAFSPQSNSLRSQSLLHFERVSFSASPLRFHGCFLCRWLTKAVALAASQEEAAMLDDVRRALLPAVYMPEEAGGAP